MIGGSFRLAKPPKHFCLAVLKLGTCPSGRIEICPNFLLIVGKLTILANLFSFNSGQRAR